MAFAHLHVHSQFSLLDGAIPIKKLAPAVAELGQKAVALTDHCNLYGAVPFHKSCKSAGVHPVFGSGLWVQEEGVDFKDPEGQFGGYHMLLLIENDAGYKNLCKLITEAIFDGMYYKPRVDLRQLEQHSEGLIALTSGMRGPIRGLLARGERQRATDRARRLAEIFGDQHLFLEMQDLAFPGDDLANEGAREIARELGLRTVVTNNVHYLKPTDAPTLDLLQCIGNGTSLNDAERTRPISDQLYLKSEEEMRELFPEDGEAIDLTGEIAERCQYAFTYGTYYFPASTPPDLGPDADTQANWDFFFKAFPPPADFGLPLDGPEAPPMPEPGCGSLGGYFKWYSREGLKKRLERVDEALYPEYWERLEIEFGIILSMGFPAYFLIVAEFINWAKDHDIPVGPGRGSAAGSLVAYAMRITDIDPIRFDLLFERFLNPERVSMPDVDVDFCQDRREEVIEHTRQKYGPEYVAQIITYGKLQAKLAIRDVSRVCDFMFNDADRVAKLIPNELGINLTDALKEEPLARLREGDPKVRRVYDMALRVEGLTRQTGVHAAGVIVADRPLVELVPLYRDGPEGGPVVQFEMKAAEDVGLIKFDFLGLKTLDQIRDAVALIHRNTGEKIDMSAIPVDDKVTYDLLCAGDGLGVFQVESSGMRELLTKLRPSVLDDVIALVALYRPGPLNAGMVDDFIDRKHGTAGEWEYPVPELEPILQSTYGVVVYQEQVMQIAQVMGGYSLGQADLLRRAMGKKQAEAMAEHRAIFCDGAESKGFDRKKAEEIFDLLAQFAAYGFNKSHSAAYGYVSYQTAWLKANHRAEYMAALMTIEASNTDKILVYIGDCKRSGLTVLPPDINASHWGFDVPKNARTTIRYGLGAVKGVGKHAVEAIVESRAEAGGCFKDLMDCLERLDYKRVNKKALEALVKAGAFDWTGFGRSALFSGLEAAISTAQRAQADKASGQVGLFGLLGGGAPKPGFRLPKVAEWSMTKELSSEREAIGFFLSGHPVVSYKQTVERFASCRVQGLALKSADSDVGVAGMPAAVRVVRTKRGDKMAFVTIDDETGGVECIFFSDPWSRSARLIKEGGPIMIRGTLEKGSEGAKIMAESVESLSDLRARTTTEVRLSMVDKSLTSQRLASLRKILELRSGNVPVTLYITKEGHSQCILRVSDSLKVQPDDDLQDDIDGLFQRRGTMRFV